MLNQFNSNTRKLNRVIKKINLNNLSGSLNDINLNLDLSGSLLNIKLPTTSSYQPNTKSNSNPTKLVNNKSTISNFHNEILIHSARYVRMGVDAFDNTANTLTIYNAQTDYGTEGASPDNFEIMVYGLHTPGNFKVEDVGNNVVITLGDRYIDFDNVTLSDIYVFGKLINVPVTTENNDIIISEGDDFDIII